MKRFLLRSVLALGLVAGLAGASPLAGQELPRQKLPRAEDILDREAEAVGGNKAHEKVKTVVTKMKMKISGQDMEIGVVIYHAGPNKQYKEFTREGYGKMEIVVDGAAAWVKDSITGARFLKGAEKAQAFRDAEEFDKLFRRVGNWRKEYKQVRTLAEEKVEGKPAYKVHMTTQKGEVVIGYYDKKSGLLVREEKDIQSPQGKEHVIEFYSDYRKVGGMVRPFTLRLVQGNVEVSITIDRLEHNVDIPQKPFTQPAELKKLQKQR